MVRFEAHVTEAAVLVLVYCIAGRRDFGNGLRLGLLRHHHLEEGGIRHFSIEEASILRDSTSHHITSLACVWGAARKKSHSR